MCRETENVLFNDEDVAEFNDVCHHIFTTVSVSRHIRTKMSITSRPARVWRVTRPEPEATRATHRQETKMPTSEQDVRMVMWTAKMSTSCCGHLRLRFRLLAMEKMIIASRRRHPHPRPAPSPSAHILWYVSPRRPPRQSNRSNRLFRSPTHPVATSTKRYRDVHRAVN